MTKLEDLYKQYIPVKLMINIPMKSNNAYKTNYKQHITK